MSKQKTLSPDVFGYGGVSTKIEDAPIENDGFWEVLVEITFHRRRCSAYIARPMLLLLLLLLLFANLQVSLLLRNSVFSSHPRCVCHVAVLRLARVVSPP